MSVTSIVANDVVEYQIFCTQNGQLSINSVQYQAVGIVNSPTYEGIVPIMDSILAPMYKAILAINATYYGSALRRLAPALSTLFGTATNTGIGTALGNAVPLAICGLIAKYGSAPGRKNRGRIYIPFPAAASTTGASEPTLIYQGLVATIGTQLFTTQTYTDLGGNAVTLLPQILQRGSPLRQRTAMQCVRGATYEITTPGNTDWRAMGAADNNALTVFVCTGGQNGNGLCQQNPVPLTITPVNKFTVRGKWGSQHRRGDYGRLNALPF